MPAEEADKTTRVVTVSALNQSVCHLLETQLSVTWVSGEISNFKRYDSGHCYFSLKDPYAQIRCVMFRSKAQQLAFIPEEGMEVEVLALPTLYAPRGDFQLNIEDMRRAGRGILFAAFEQLKAKLQAEGLFAEGRKRALPRFPRTVGVVSSLQGAAIQDMLTTLRRRLPSLRIIIYPTAVQGLQAAPEIARAIQRASSRAEVDVLIVGRGGGSIEDLWAFNDEQVARSISAAPMPVISAVGHETDFTIADFVADVRAPTPTAAAELASPDCRVWQQRLLQYRRYLVRHMSYTIAHLLQRTGLFRQRFLAQIRRLDGQRVKLAHAAWRLQQAQLHYAQRKQQRCAYLRQQLLRSTPRIDVLLQRLCYNEQRLQGVIAALLNQQRAHLHRLAAEITGFDPARILARGYSLVTDQQGSIVRSAEMLRRGDDVLLRFAAGYAHATVTDTVGAESTS